MLSAGREGAPGIGILFLLRKKKVGGDLGREWDGETQQPTHREGEMSWSLPMNPNDSYWGINH